MRETIAGLKKDIASRDIRFFSEIDPSRLAAGAGVELHPSTLLVFGTRRRARCIASPRGTTREPARATTEIT
jgi:uncharacterized protein (DUF302 family)